MEPEILFRGKSTTGHWVYGLPIKLAEYKQEWRWGIQAYLENGDERIHNTTFVNPETIGQYIGETDKNGEEIFKDDILKTNEGGWIGTVVFGDGMFFCTDKDSGFSTFCDWGQFEKIGNIHDNPELKP
jgi:uncharacterized phage protein (TIGR01671 family)